MKVLQFENLGLLNYSYEVAYLKAANTSTGSNRTLILDSNDDLSENDYLMIGNLGEKKTEVVKINSAVSGSTDVQVDNLDFAHPAGTKVYKIRYNQIRFKWAENLTGTKSTLATKDLDVDDNYTTYIDDSNTSGYAFFQLYNSETSEESDLSVGIPYSAISSQTKQKIRKFVRAFYKKEWDEEVFDMLLDGIESEIFSMKRWTFREKSATFTTTADTGSYSFSDAGVSDMGQLFYATYDDDPLQIVQHKVYQRVNWEDLTSVDSRIIHIWGDQIELLPVPPEEKTVKLWYYKRSEGMEDETSETSVRLPNAVSYKILADMWAPHDENKASYYEKRYVDTIQAMLKDDKTQVGRASSLLDSSHDKLNTYDQLNNPTITT